MVGFSLFCLLVSPFIFFSIKRQALAYVNIMMIVSSLAIWGSLIAGWVMDRFWVIMWNLTLQGSVLFLVIGLSMVFLKIRQKNLYLLPVLVLATAVGSLFIGNYFGNGTELNIIVLCSFAYFTPMFVSIITLTGATQYFKNA